MSDNKKKIYSNLMKIKMILKLAGILLLIKIKHLPLMISLQQLNIKILKYTQTRVKALKLLLIQNKIKDLKKIYAINLVGFFTTEINFINLKFVFFNFIFI